VLPHLQVKYHNRWEGIVGSSLAILNGDSDGATDTHMQCPS